jgi:Dyp-type peroxidase family
MAGLLAAAADAGLTVAYQEEGQKLESAREHFGFRDGVSQPGVRGRYDTREGAFITPRAIAAGVQPESDLYGLPGQDLVWPGEFVFGYPAATPDPMLAGLENRPGPAWSRNGSYLAFRRLAQDVQGFASFVRTEAARLSQLPGWETWTADRVGAAIVGRWPSGAPLSRSHEKDNEELGADRFANNNFNFALTPPDYDLRYGDRRRFDPASSDPVGTSCPLSAHIRKVNTRASANDRGASRSALNRRILRRGLPYGTPDAAEKGLLFLSYQASITDQFEFLMTAWMNDRAAPRSPSGHDLLVGQNGEPGQGRSRSAAFLNAEGAAQELTAASQFVTPTGGGYFFTPAVSAVREVIGTPGPGLVNTNGMAGLA